MTRQDYLNAASDLRRIANWMARGQTEKLPLIKRLWKDTNSRKRISFVLKHFVGKIKPQDVIRDKNSRLFLQNKPLYQALVSKTNSHNNPLERSGT